MKLLVSSTSNYLLSAGIDVLHSQSNEWISEIDFWRDETAFYYALVIEKTMISVPVDAKDLLMKIEHELVNLTGGQLDELKIAVYKHEAFLSDLLENDLNSETEENYRNKHKVIEMKIRELERHFKILKKEIFELVKLSPKNNL
jgi:hypothetical protein